MDALYVIVQLAVLVALSGAVLAACSVLEWLAGRHSRAMGNRLCTRGNVVRGNGIGTLADAKADLDRNAPPADQVPRTIPLGGTVQPRSEEPTHKLVIGATGTGKTKTMLADMNATVPRIVRPLGGETVGALLYDDSKILVPYVAGLIGHERMKILTPFDARGVRIDFALFNTEAKAQLLTDIYIPHPKNDHQPYWINAAQDIMTGLIMVFNQRTPGRWDPRDVHEGAASPLRARFVLRQTPYGASKAASHLEVEQMAGGVMGTLNAAIREFRPLAALWDRTTEVIDLKSTVQNGGYALILQPSEEHPQASRAVNRLWLTLSLQYVLALPDSDLFRFFVFLDEVQELGRIDILPRATSIIRSKGGMLLYYTQVIDALYEIYGEYLTHKILDNVSMKTIYSVFGRTAKWASEQFGQIEIGRYVPTISPEGKISKTLQYNQTDAVLGSELSGIAPPSPEHGIAGLHRARITRAFYSRLTHFERLLPTPLPDVPAFIPRPEEDEDLRPWDMEDLRRLNLEIGPDDDLEAILGKQPKPVPPPPEAAAPKKQEEVAEPKLIGKLYGLFRGGREER